MLSVFQGYLFHTVAGKHQDLKYIDSEMVGAAGTVRKILTGKEEKRKRSTNTF